MNWQSMKPFYEPIALIGMGCRFPGRGNDPRTFWDFLLSGTDAVTEIPKERWDLSRHYHPDPTHPGTMYTRYGAFLEQIDHFDAAFFGISSVEADAMDPQQRLLLEASWEAMEDAGIVPSRLAGSATGVFIGVCTSDYLGQFFEEPERINPYTMGGGALSIVANRLSYFFDLRGPSFSIDTACSSSLVAVHQACESLRKGECSLALAGGVNLILTPSVNIGFSKASMLSPHGHCYSFDARADGYVRGEGTGVVLLKPLAQALKDNDPIYAVIRGTGINQDGHTLGLHYPNIEAQVELIRRVYADAQMLPEEVQYVEAHGTGTVAGDAVECRALGTVFAPSRSAAHPLRIGSVKSTVGHLEGASGMAGLIKAALMIKHRQIPANLHFQTPNPQIPFADLRLSVAQTLETLPSTVEPFTIGINSFGFGGTNAHVILQTAPTLHKSQSAPVEDTFLLPLSARSPQALQALAQAYLDILQKDTVPLADLCFTASQRREHHTYRLALVIRSHAELAEKLVAFLAGEKRPGLVSQHIQKGQHTKVAFVFSGNGPQWWAMGRQLLAQHALFRAVIERCDQHLRPLTGWSLLEELSADEQASHMERTGIAQPALFALQIALAAVWQSYGIEPQAVIGHSVGEVAAAYIAGVLSFEEAITVIFHRSHLQERTAGMGQMLAAGLSAQDAQEMLEPYGGRVSLASINAHQSVTLSGETQALEEIAASLTQRGIFSRLLKLNYAFHHQTMDLIHADLLAALTHLQPQNGNIPFISTVEGGEMAGVGCGAEYWWQNVRAPVQFAAGIQQLVESGFTTFLEIGPHPVLSSYITECLADYPGHVLPSLRRNAQEQALLLSSLGTLYTLGHPIRWESLLAQGHVVRLPTYPWQRQRHWYKAETTSAQKVSPHPLLGYRQKTAQATWENSLDRYDLLYLRDHGVAGAVLFPAVGYCEIFRAAASEIFGQGTYEITHLAIQERLFLAEEQEAIIQTVYDPDAKTIQVYSKDREGWTTRATGQVKPWQPATTPRLDLEVLRTRCPQAVNATAFHKLTRRIGFLYGPTFQLVDQVFFGPREAFGRIQQPFTLSEQDRAPYVLHPALIDCCVQVMFSVAFNTDADFQRFFLPVGIERVRCYTQILPATPLYCRFILTHQQRHLMAGDYVIMDEDGNTLVEIIGLRVQASVFSGQHTTRSLEDALYAESWLPAPLRPQYGTLPAPAHFEAPMQVICEQVREEISLAGLSQQTLAAGDQLCLMYIVGTLQQLGWTFSVGEYVTVPALCQNLGILEKYEQLIAAWCMILAEEHILQAEATGWLVLQTPTDMQRQDLLLVALTQHPEHHALLRCLKRCGDNLADMLVGNTNAHAILFAEHDFSTLEYFYSGETFARCNNRLLQQALQRLIEQLPADKVLHILEIGAGTGGTTSYLLPILPADRTVYVFTDISEAFLQRAQQNYRSYPFVTYQLLDIERDPQAQGFAQYSFDLIVAANVLHATTTIANTLRQVCQLLGSEGWLALIEMTNGFSRFPLLTFGLLEGYWKFEDRDVRPDQPVLTEQAWKKMLAETGFRDIVAFSVDQEKDSTQELLFLAQGPRHVQPEQPVPALPATWLIFADEQGLAKQLREMLEADAATVIMVEKGTVYQRVASQHFLLRPCCAEDMQRLLMTLRGEEKNYAHIIYLWGIDYQQIEYSTPVLQAAVEESCISLLQLIQAQLKISSQPLPRLWAVTSGAHQRVGQTQAIAVAQAPLPALLRVLANEYPDFQSTLIDLSVPREYQGTWLYAMADVHALYDELQTQAQESEVLLRGGTRFVNRIVRAALERRVRTAEVLAQPDTSFSLKISMPGNIDTLSLHTASRMQPRRGEVEIAVDAVGLNFKDVAYAMKLIPAEDGSFDNYTFGLECVGKIVAVGEDVTNFAVGDEVIALGGNCLGAFHAADARIVVHKPVGQSSEEAASTMHVFLTAYYALHYLAHLKQGERVLIHSATGGIGLAALQIVQQAGGEVFATVGSSEKRAYLRSLGIKYVFDSRSLDFADEIMHLTHGEGVDVILNSLVGEAVEQSMGLLRRFGRFLELGKRDFLAHKKLDLQPFQHSLAYFSIDTDQLLRYAPDLAQTLLAALVQRFEQKVYRPLPYLPFQLYQVKEAFRYMQQARHIGKLVILLRQQDALVSVHPQTQPFTLQADATYLITGGVRGFGLATARWMVAHGARHLVLVSRSGTPLPEDVNTFDEMRAAGAEVWLESVDIVQEHAVMALLERLKDTQPPLRGIVHAAAVFDDHPLEQLDVATWRGVVAPKMLGAWNLHKQTNGLALDFFVLYSSASSLIGNKGQGNYAAGNRFLEALACQRQLQGLPALVVGWGALAQVGYAARNTWVTQQLAHLGMTALDPSQSLDLLGIFLQEKRTQVFVALEHWSKLATAWSSDWAHNRWTHLLTDAQEVDSTPEQWQGSLAHELLAMIPETRQAAILTYLQQALTLVLGASGTESDSLRSLTELGLDSLMAMELRNRVKRDLGIDIPLMQLLRPQSMIDLAAWAALQIEERAPSQASVTTHPTAMREEAVSPE